MAIRSMAGSMAVAVAVFFLLAGLAGCGGGVRKVEGELFYLALGASDAVGIGASPLSNGYVYRIEKALAARHEEGVNLLNLGIPGAKVEEIDQALETLLKIEVRPDLVTLWTGANDLIGGADPEEFEAGLKRILERLSAETNALVVIGDLPDLTQIPRFVAEPAGSVTRERIAAFNAAIDRQADAFDLEVARLSAVPLQDDLTSDLDGFHPSDEGHREIARVFLQVILPAFGLEETQ